MTNLYYVCCINDKELQEITKTQVVGLQKLKYPIFLCLTFTDPLRCKWNHQLCHICRTLIFKAVNVVDKVLIFTKLPHFHTLTNIIILK